MELLQINTNCAGGERNETQEEAWKSFVFPKFFVEFSAN